MTFRNGLDSLLRPEDSVLVLIDHQPYQLTNLNSHDPQTVVNNSTALAKSAKAFGVPTILTSVIAERGGLIFPQITDVFPGQEVIDRTFINTWEDQKVVDAVKATGRKQLILAGLWTEVCVALPAIQALGEGWDVTVVTDASGGVSVEAHEVAIKRMIAAGANMMTWLAVAAEWQRDWARLEHVAELTEILKQHAAGSGIAYLWEQQLLNTPVPVAQVDIMIEVIEQRRRNLGGGMEVGRVLPFAKRRMVGPFIFFDHMGPLDLAPGVDRSMDIRPHPHIGLATVTYLFSGEIMHRDSLGYEQAVRPQEVNWMTAGRGITHSERFERARTQGDHLHGIQAWVALPTELEEIAPSFSHHSASELPTWSEAGVDGQLIAGSAYGLTAGVETHSPLFYAHLDMAPGAMAEIPSGHKERAIYIATGAVEFEGNRYDAGRMLVFGAAASSLRALERSVVMVLGGEPVGERFLYWNFVSSSKDRLEQAASDWRAGRMKLPDADDKEFIPLPA